jgi:FKBP-type peptidyl-prolyl cis-trans isomerase
MLLACSGQQQDKPVDKPADLKEPLIKANKHVVDTEDEQIDDFLARYRWEMTRTKSGLRYMIYKSGEGRAVGQSDRVVLKYKVSFLNGDVVYTSDEDGPLDFVRGKGQAIPGVEEGAGYLRKGDKARLIVPSYLAYGLIGDQKKIGFKATLVYDIEVIEVSDK